MERDDTRRGRAKRVGDCSRWLSREQNVADGSGGASETHSREPFRDAGHRQPGYHGLDNPRYRTTKIPIRIARTMKTIQKIPITQFPDRASLTHPAQRNSDLPPPLRNTSTVAGDTCRAQLSLPQLWHRVVATVSQA